jgi:hypothetical protein
VGGVSQGSVAATISSTSDQLSSTSDQLSFGGSGSFYGSIDDGAWYPNVVLSGAQAVVHSGLR